MHRSGWSRLLAGALTAWFGLIMAAPVVLHTCPQALATRGVSAHAGMHDHHGSHSTPAQNERAPKDCTCLGQCRGPAPAVLPRAVVGPMDAPLRVAEHSGAVSPAVRLPTAPDHIQPFATAPPLPQA